jgi:hypothetical protein
LVGIQGIPGLSGPPGPAGSPSIYFLYFCLLLTPAKHLVTFLEDERIIICACKSSYMGHMGHPLHNVKVLVEWSKNTSILHPNKIKHFKKTWHFLVGEMSRNM